MSASHCVRNRHHAADKHHAANMHHESLNVSKSFMCKWCHAVDKHHAADKDKPPATRHQGPLTLGSKSLPPCNQAQAHQQHTAVRTGTAPLSNMLYRCQRHTLSDAGSHARVSRQAQTPPDACATALTLPPPMGRVVSAFLRICSKPRNLITLRVTVGWKRRPPL